MNLKQMVENISALKTEILSRAEKAGERVDRVAMQLKGLQDAGGMCDEHAGTILKTLLPELKQLESFVWAVSSQIKDL